MNVLPTSTKRWAHKVDAELILYGLWHPRYWNQLPWRIVYLFDPAKGKAMRKKWRARH